MYLNETYAKKWAPVLDHPELPKISDPYKRAVTALVLENQENALRQEAGAMQNLWESPANAMGVNGNGGIAGLGTNTGAIAGFDPILIGLVRRSLPNLMAYDICGVQPMTGPTGLIFAMKSTFANDTIRGSEALFGEANTGYSGNASATALATLNANIANVVLANTGAGMSTAYGEGLTPAYMGFQIDRVSVTANTRALQAAYTLELAQDLKAVHGLDAETELSNILSTEILAEINREVVRTVYSAANVGVVSLATASINLATNDITTGVSGRWQVEKYKSLLFQIERAANKIAKDTRRGKGNMLIVSTDVASALAMTGLLDYNSALSNNTNLAVDDTGNTFAGTLFGRIKVYVDPYSVTGTDYVIVGYKGTTPYDAGIFYCPYVPLQMVRAIDPATYQPKIGFKTRYGMVANPFSTGAGTSSGAITDGTNVYYRKFQILNISGSSL
jgi:Major capsid protein Gp23